MFSKLLKKPRTENPETTSPAATNEAPPIFYFAPHQDDELLTMGVDACQQIIAGRDVHIFLCTDGSKSGVRGVLSNGEKCPKHEGTHEYELDVSAFSDARDREFYDSCIALGYRPSRIHYYPQRAIDGSLGVDYATSILLNSLKTCPAAEVRTISPLSGPAQHRDHRALGQAAVQLANEGVIAKLTLCVEPYHLGDFKELNPQIELNEQVASQNDEIVNRIATAIASYQLWNPQRQRFAVGYHSVTTEFDDFMAIPATRSYLHCC